MMNNAESEIRFCVGDVCEALVILDSAFLIDFAHYPAFLGMIRYDKNQH